MIKKLVLLLIIPAALLLFAKFGAMSILMHSWNAVVEYTPPFTAPLPAGKAGQALTDQVVIVVVDALRDDASRAPAMPNLNGMRAKGATLAMAVGQPSLSLPGWSVIGTGTWQEESGVTTNWFKGAVKTDDIFAQAKRKGLRTAVVGSKDWEQLFGGNLDVMKWFPAPSDAYTNPAAVGKEDDEVLSTALSLLKGGQPPSLLLVHFAGPDDAGHGRGGASDVYKQVVKGIDDRLAVLAAGMDLTRSTLIVTSDHGTSDSGGHGGWEESVLKVPFVVVGKGVKSGSYTAATQADIAPTLAMLLGTSIPAHNQGEALFDLLDLPERVRAERALDSAQQLAAFYAQYARAIGAMPFDQTRLMAAEDALVKGDVSASYHASRGFVQDIRRQAEAARESRLRGERLGRTPMVLLLAAPFVLWLIIMAWQRMSLSAPLTGALLYFAIYNALFFGRGNLFSLSAFNSEDQIQAYFTQRGTDALIALALATLLAGILSRRRTLYEATLAGVNALFLVALGLAVQVLAFYWTWGWEFSWYLPDLAWGFKYYLDMLQTSVFWPLAYLPAAAILPLLAGLVSRMARIGMKPEQPPVNPKPA
jgi:hypothetical protein